MPCRLPHWHINTSHSRLTGSMELATALTLEDLPSWWAGFALSAYLEILCLSGPKELVMNQDTLLSVHISSKGSSVLSSESCSGSKPPWLKELLPPIPVKSCAGCTGHTLGLCTHILTLRRGEDVTLPLISRFWLCNCFSTSIFCI